MPESPWTEEAETLTADLVNAGETSPAVAEAATKLLRGSEYYDISVPSVMATPRGNLKIEFWSGDYGLRFVVGARATRMVFLAKIRGEILQAWKVFRGPRRHRLMERYEDILSDEFGNRYRMAVDGPGA